MARPLLTIAIPTYNRVEQIQRQVRLLLPQLTSQIKLVVHDNCSSTPVNTLFTLDELSQFSISRNNVNIGGDANIARCSECCQTKWLWTLGDDDYIRPDAVATVLDWINKYPNAEWINFDNTCEYEINNVDDFLSSINSRTSYGNLFWISKCVYNIELLKDYQYMQFRHTSLMIGQLMPLIRYALDKQNILYIRTTTLILEETTPGGWSKFDFLRYTSMTFDIFNATERQILRKKFLKELFLLNLNYINSLFLDSEHKKSDILYYFRLLLLRYGLLYAIIDGKYVFIRALISSMLPHGFLTKIKSHIVRIK